MNSKRGGHRGKTLNRDATDFRGETARSGCSSPKPPAGGGAKPELCLQVSLRHVLALKLNENTHQSGPLLDSVSGDPFNGNLKGENEE